MTVSEIGVHTGRINTDIQNLKNGLNRTRRHIRDLRERMDALNRMWDGEANAAMRLRFQADQESLISLCDFLDALIRQLEAARQEYDTCENDVSSAISALRVR